MIAGVLAASSAAAGGSTVMGCHSFSSPGPNLFTPAHEPSRCYFSTGTTGIVHVRWSHWGRPRATGRGVYLDRLGFEHKASMVISGLFRPCNGPGGPGVYSRLRVTWQPSRAAGVLRGGGKHVFNVVPSDMSC